MSTYKSKKVVHIPFDEVFDYAKEDFDIDWNSANDLFFGNAFEYNEISYVEIDEEYLNLTNDEILDLNTDEKANAILSKFLCGLDIEGGVDEIYIDSK